MTYAQRANAYAERVVAGDVPACRYVRLACQRHRDDLERDGFPYAFDAEKADRVCRFMELMPHVKGKWASRHERIRLEDWQCFMLACAFGWVRTSDGMRRFRRVYLEVPRKNAKSTLSAGVGLYMLAIDGEYGAEVYSGATTEKQAWEVFRPARLMALQTPTFVDRLGVEVGAKNIHIPSNGSRFEAIIGNPGDGASPSCAIVDEYHEHATSEQYDTMLTGMDAREQPLLWVITTAGADTAGPCYALRSEVLRVLDGTVPNDELWGVVYTVDEGDNWADPSVLAKANPNLDVSVGGEFLRTQQRDAINDPRKQSTFKTKHLNVWVTAASPYFNSETWSHLADAPPEQELRGAECYAGMDLASKSDLSCVLRLYRREVGGAPHFYVYPRFYVPELALDAPESRHYADWAARGFLTATPGNITDYDYIEGDLVESIEAAPILEVGFDPYNATHLATRLGNAGLAMVEVPQTVRNLSEPMKEIDALIRDGRIHHDGNPALAWCIGNVTAQVDRNENVFPRKERHENKIDGAVALIVAMSRAMAPREVPTYDVMFL